MLVRISRKSAWSQPFQAWLSTLSFAGVLACLSAPAGAIVHDPFPDPRPATRTAALAVVAGEEPAPLGCLTPRIQNLAGARLGSGLLVHRALTLLGQRSDFTVERRTSAADGTPVWFTDEPSAFDRVTPLDLSGNGVPDLVEHAIAGLDEARRFLVEQLRLTAPQRLEVVLVELGPQLEGYLVSREDGVTIVLDGSRAVEGPAIRGAAIHQYTHAVVAAVGARMRPEWGEALATWVESELLGGPDDETTALLSQRIERLAEGLGSRAADLGPGNALWFAFLNEAYGPESIAGTVEELAQGGSATAALDRALARVSGEGLAAAFREFQLWTVLSGPRADRYHFSFGPRLSGPHFASVNDGLPALSVLADPPVAAWGATQVRVVPGEEQGGLGLHFEGGVGAAWEADLLLWDTSGAVRRLALPLDGGGRGEIAVPLDGVAEVVMLVRNLGSQDGAAHRYTYAAHREPGYPVEFGSLEARHLGHSVDLSWETSSEQELIGFNILRSRDAGGTESVVNPVWIPALGERDASTSYQYFDRSVEPGASYRYRVQAITVRGMTSLSDPVVVRRPAR